MWAGSGAQAGAPISASLRPAASHWDPGSELLLEILAPDGSRLASQFWSGNAPAPESLDATSKVPAWHLLRLTATRLPPPGQMPFELTVTYTASQTLE